MKKILIITVSLMLLFLNIPAIVSATSVTTQPTITLSQTKVKSGDTIQFEIAANNTLEGLANSEDNVILMRSRVNETQTISLQPDYNENTGKYESKYTIPTNMVLGEWYIEKAVLQDNEGSSTYNYTNITFTVTVDSIVNFNSNGGSGTAGLSVEYTGKAVEPANPTKTGFTFGGWYIDNNTFANLFDFKNTEITENITLSAKWIINNSTVIFNSQGGSGVTNNTANYNSTIIAPATPTKTGYTFAGWYKESSCLNVWNFTTNKIIANTTLYAKWIINNSTVTFNSQGGSAVSKKNANYNSTIIAPSTPTKTGYTFAGWYKESGCLNVWNFTTNKVIANTTLYAKWTIVIPGMPTSLKAASSSYNSINVYWGAVTGAIGYEVYRSTSNTGTYTLISNTNKTNYNNTGLTTYSNYYYKVRTYKMASNVKVYSNYSTVVSAKPILAPPVNAIATRINSKSIKLNWSAVTGANGYEIYGATTITGTYSLLTRTTNLFYTNSNLITGKNYYYKIKSYRTVGKIRVYSNWTTVTNKTITYTVFNNLVQSNAVYGKYAGLKVEILDQFKTKYLIRKANGTTMWVYCYKVSVPKNPVTNSKYLDKKQLENYVNITSNFISKTKYFTWVDLNRQRVNIFTGSAGHWVLVKSYSCASGNNATPSKRGLFTVQDKGNSFVTDSKLLVKYWTRFSGNYLLHSILLTKTGKIYNGTVGKRASHGCIRMPLDMAKWYYDKMPKGSLIWVN